MKRIAELDALRGLAAIGIVAYHYSYPSRLYDLVLHLGVTSLDLFFVLSGYLISSIALDHAGERGFLRNFYFRRSLRIWPIYYLTIVAFIVLVAVRPGMGSIKAAPYYLLFIQNIQYYWFGEPTFLHFAVMPTWSLAVEEQFYIFWPLLLALFGLRDLPLIAISWIAVAIASRGAGFSQYILITNCDGFAIGGQLAILVARSKGSAERERVAARGLAVVLVAAAVLLLAFRLGPVAKTVTSCLFASVTGLLVFGAGSPLLAPMRFRPLCFLGTISYGVYLYHLTAMMFAHAITGRVGLSPVLNALVLAPLICLTMAIVSWHVIEKPVLRLKDRFRYGPKSAERDT
jgi:peptidoglycan/LPS O-acetylase OafA/YrhL